MADDNWGTSAWIDDENFCTDHFRMFEFKVKRCPRAKPHDWTACPFAHPTEKAKRRCPVNYRYNGTACTDFRKNGNCRRGDACPFAHGVFEAWLHPARYRTKMCTDAACCKRRVCFFAHSQEELRRPTEDSDIADLRTELLSQSQQQERKSFGNSVSNLLAASQLDNIGERATVLQLLQQQLRNQQLHQLYIPSSNQTLGLGIQQQGSTMMDQQQQVQAYQMTLQQAAAQEQLDQELLINQSLLGAHNGLMAAAGTEGSQATVASLAAQDAHARLLSPQRTSFSGLGPASSLDHEMAFFSPGTPGSRRSSMDVVSMSTHNSFADGFGHNYAGSTGLLQPAGSARQSLEEMMGISSLSSNQSDAVNLHFARETLFGFGQQALSAAPGNGFSQALWSHPNQEAGSALENSAANGMLHTSSAELCDQQGLHDPSTTDLLRQHGSIGLLETVPEIATPRSSAEEPKGLDQAVVSNVTFPARSSLDHNGSSSPMAQHPSVDRMLSELPRTLSEMNL